MPEDEFRRTEFYQDYLRRTGVFYGLGGLVERADGRIAVFGVQRGYEDGRFPAETVSLVGALMPHLKRAYRMQSAVGRASARSRDLRGNAPRRSASGADRRSRCAPGLRQSRGRATARR